MTANPRGRRRGLVSVVVLVALIIIAIVSAGLLKVAFARRASIATQERRLQADWLADSGLERASARLRASGDFAGEVWEIPAGELGGRGAATVSIRVERVAGEPARRKVVVRAEYPTGSSLVARQGKEMVLQVTPSPR